MNQPVQIRLAQPEEAADLSALACRSKAHWPYDGEFLAACVELLKVYPEDVAKGLTFLAQDTESGDILGFYQLDASEVPPEMTSLFVEPSRIGKGVGMQLWQHALGAARNRGWTQLQIVADPYAAKSFYEPRGCRQVGEVAAGVSGRMLPLYVYDLQPIA